MPNHIWQGSLRSPRTKLSKAQHNQAKLSKQQNPKKTVKATTSSKKQQKGIKKQKKQQKATKSSNEQQKATKSSNNSKKQQNTAKKKLESFSKRPYLPKFSQNLPNPSQSPPTPPRFARWGSLRSPLRKKQIPRASQNPPKTLPKPSQDPSKTLPKSFKNLNFIENLIFDVQGPVLDSQMAPQTSPRPPKWRAKSQKNQ